MRTNYLTKSEIANVEKVMASLKNVVKDADTASYDELVKAGTFVVNDYIAENPSLLDLSSLLFNPGQVNGDVLDVEIGHGGVAYMHAIGSQAVLSQAYIERVSTKMNRFSFASKIDVNAVRTQNVVKLLEDAAEIRFKLGLKKFRYIWDLVKATITTGDPIYISAATVNKTNLDSIMNTMMDTSGSVKAIIGRESLVTQIMGFSGWSEVTLREIETGVFGQYRGARLVGIKNYETTIVDAAGTKFDTAQIPADQLILLGEKCGYDGENPVQTLAGTDVLLGAEVKNTFFDYAAIIVDEKKIGVYNIA